MCEIGLTDPTRRIGFKIVDGQKMQTLRELYQVHLSSLQLVRRCRISLGE